ncbi:hypothetical protein ACJA23_03205 [Mycoplasma corogypsi]|uniref:hypothetical protein n=1 Tax=Mycoplasma corogypsi TaxID=2106 RepID=UPI003872E254
MKKIQFQKIPFRTKIRWLFLGKLPLERKNKPKIVEYMFLLFNNLLLLACTIYLPFMLLTMKEHNAGIISTSIFIKTLQQEMFLKVFVTLVVVLELMNLTLAIHIYYILSKTEFNKWIPILATLSSILFISPVAILCCIAAYHKNELAFE